MKSVIAALTAVSLMLGCCTGERSGPGPTGGQLTPEQTAPWPMAPIFRLGNALDKYYTATGRWPIDANDFASVVPDFNRRQFTVLRLHPQSDGAVAVDFKIVQQSNGLFGQEVEASGIVFEPPKPKVGPTTKPP